MSDDTLGRLIGRQLEDIDVLLDRSSVWDPMAQLVEEMPQTWCTVRAEILKFLQVQQSSTDPE